MKRLSLLKAALPMALVCGPLLADDVVEIHGYMRSGVGRSSEGGEQVSFGLGIVPSPGFRLGNEVDNYIELAVDVKAYEKGNTAFKLHFRPTFREWYNQRDASYNAAGGGNAFAPNQKILLRETWGEATGVFGKSSDAFKDATIWGGRRFYQRSDAHMIDYFFLNNSGDGVGIEGINLGFAKFHAAYIQQDFGELIVGSYDFRLTDIVTNPGGSLTVALQLQRPANLKSADQTATQSGGNTNGGWRVDLMHKQGGILGGDNMVTFNYRVGSPLWGWYNADRGDKNKAWEVVDQFFIQPSKSFGMGVTALYRDQTIVTNVTGPDSTGSQKAIMIGARPVWFFTNHLSLAAELSYESLDRDKFFAPGTSKAHVSKETIALQWQPQASWWSRPSLRLFVTNAQWGTDKNPNASWQTYSPANFAADKTSGMTYGFQVEAWW
jgi:maltoporin